VKDLRSSQPRLHLPCQCLVERSCGEVSAPIGRSSFAENVGVREEIASKIRKHLTATPHGVKVMAERSKTDLCVVAAAVVVDVVEEFLVVDVHRR